MDIAMENRLLESLKKLLEAKSYVTRVIDSKDVQDLSNPAFNTLWKDFFSYKADVVLNVPFEQEQWLELNLAKIKLAKAFLKIIVKKEKQLRSKLRMKGA